MIVAHTWPRNGSEEELLVDGRPSVLFVVVAGIALGLVTARAASAAQPAAARSRQRRRLAVRALILFAFGIALWALPSGIAIILDYYGVLFVLALPLLFAPRWVLAVVSAALLVAAPLARDAIVAAGPPSAEPWSSIVDYLFTGFYPAVLWLPLIGFGLLATRSGLERTRTRVVLLLGGSTASVAGYGAAAVFPAVTAEDHSGTIAELLGAGGLAFALVGVFLLVLDPAGGAPRVIRVALAPLTAMGRVALTVYVGHVLVIVALSSLGPAGQFSSPVGETLAAALVVSGVLTGLTCTALRRRGPLEALLSGSATLAGGARTIPSERSRVED